MLESETSLFLLYKKDFKELVRGITDRHEKLVTTSRFNNFQKLRKSGVSLTSGTRSMGNGYRWTSDCNFITKETYYIILFQTFRDRMSRFRFDESYRKFPEGSKPRFDDGL